MGLDETPRPGATNSQLLIRMGIDPNETPESLYKKVMEAQTKATNAIKELDRLLGQLGDACALFDAVGQLGDACALFDGPDADWDEQREKCELAIEAVEEATHVVDEQFPDIFFSKYQDIWDAIGKEDE